MELNRVYAAVARKRKLLISKLTGIGSGNAKCIPPQRDYRVGGPRSVWEENPVLLNVTADACMLALITCNCGAKEAAGRAATVGGTACTQQFMGHLSESL